MIAGIDLGTTNSEIAVIEDGKPRVIVIDGEQVMPSCVGIDSDGRLLVGRPAKNQMVTRPQATVLSVKRRMGQADKIQLADRQFSPEEISSLILKKLKQEAEKQLGVEISKAVITVPAYFSDSQRKATRQAGILAGFEVMRIINEPTAAALAYDAGLENDRNILVYDLGGGTFDVSLVRVQDSVVEVLASHGDTRLGGDDFDNLLMEYVADIFREQHPVDLLADPASRNRLWAAVEKAKRQLSDMPVARIREEFIHGDLHLDVEIYRHDYEELIRPLVKKTLASIHKCLKEASMLPGAISQVILVGGSTRTPLVAEILRDELGKEPRHEISPELIVAMGAAIQAGVIGGQKTSSVLVDITPYTFGIRARSYYQGRMSNHVFVPLIRRNTALPARKGELFATTYDNQQAVDIQVYQGENPLVRDNIFIGNFMVEGLSRMPAGNKIQVNLDLDLNGILEVTAVELKTGLSKSVRLDTGTAAGSRHALPANDVPEGGDGGAGGKDPLESLAATSRQYCQRAERLLEDLDETDAAELKSLMEQSRKAIEDRDAETLEQLNESLSDMLFYLED